MTNKKKSIATLAAVVLAIVLAVPGAAAEAPAIRVSSYKGSTLEVGERSGLIIGPSRTEYTVTSSDPDIVTVEQVLNFWVAVAKEAGNAEITVSNSAGEYGTVTFTVDAAADPAPPVEDGNTCLTDNMEIRQEMIRLINQTRRANGVPELPVSEALMNAAQACSTLGTTPRRRAKPLLMPATPTVSGPTSPCSPVQLMPPNTPSTTGSILPVTSRPWSTRDATV